MSPIMVAYTLEELQVTKEILNGLEKELNKNYTKEILYIDDLISEKSKD